MLEPIGSLHIFKVIASFILVLLPVLLLFHVKLQSLKLT